jgi:hypothetical protein
MTSTRQIDANRRNAQRSTGPKTQEGKLASRNNALRHGLARPIENDPDLILRRQELTAIFAQGSRDEGHREIARDVADGFLALGRIRSFRSQVLEQLGEFEQALPKDHDQGLRQLQRIQRYERRVLSHRRKALRALYQAMLAAEPSA